MKTTFRKMFLFAMMSTLIVSCGKGNSSGSSSKAPGIGDVKEFTENTVSNADLAAIQQKFNSLNMTSNGVQVGNHIQFMGSYYGASTSSVSGSFSYCIDLIFWQSGDCNKNSYGSYWDYVMNYGRYFKIDSVAADKNNLSELTGYTTHELQFDPVGYTSKSANMYKKMLALDYTAGTSMYSQAAPKASVAEVYVGSVSNPQQVTKVEAYLIENFSTGEKYVVSPQLPISANPIYIWKSNGQEGYLVKAGTKMIKSIKFNYSNVNYMGQPTFGGYYGIQVYY